MRTRSFRIRLDGNASLEKRQLADAEAIADLQERMKLCPIARYVPEDVSQPVEQLQHRHRHRH
ncbi:hypothetical protein KBY76_02650 [Synechococcus sp. GreenBA-s]|nr:hypothetical protein [Synechococcus sp. GreenBA-s]